jgi:hypothetical protein
MRRIFYASASGYLLYLACVNRGDAAEYPPFPIARGPEWMDAGHAFASGCSWIPLAAGCLTGWAILKEGGRVTHLFAMGIALGSSPRARAFQSGDVRTPLAWMAGGFSVPALAVALSIVNVTNHI